MSLISRISRGISPNLNPQGLAAGEHVVEQLFGGLVAEGTESGEYVTPDKALSLPPVFKALRLISETGGALPLKTYRRGSKGSREEVRESQHELLHDRPNDSETAVQFWTRAFAHFEGWGAMFIGKEWRGRELGALHLIEPKRMRIERLGNGRLRFWETRHNGTTRKWSDREVIFIPLFCLDGVTPLSPIGYQRETIGLALAMRKQASRLYADAAIPGGVLTIKDEIKKPEVKDRLRKEWNERHRGRRDIAVLDAGATFEQVSISLADAQYIELIGASRTDIADMFNMPASLLNGGAGDSLTYGNRMQDLQHFLTFTLHNPLRKVEAALSTDRDLFPNPDEYTEFLRDALLQPDPKTRADINRLAGDPKWGWMDRDEIRERENLPTQGRDSNSINQGDL